MLTTIFQYFDFFLGAFVALFVVIDPFAVLPVYISLTKTFGEEEKRQTRIKASLYSVGILIVFTFTGMFVFKAFGITLPAFQIAGGILLFNFGISQLSANRERVTAPEQEESAQRDDVSVFPLATPLLAGPGAISTVVLYATNASDFIQICLVGVGAVLTIALTYYLLSLAPWIFKVLGHTGLNLVTRIMGIIVTAIAIQFIINGIKNSGLV